MPVNPRRAVIMPVRPRPTLKMTVARRGLIMRVVPGVAAAKLSADAAEAAAVEARAAADEVAGTADGVVADVLAAAAAAAASEIAAELAETNAETAETNAETAQAAAELAASNAASSEAAAASSASDAQTAETNAETAETNAEAAAVAADASADAAAASAIAANASADAAAASAAIFDPSDYATAAQGATADSALQPAAIGTTVQGYDADLAAVAGLATTGIVRRTGAGTFTAGTTVATAEVADDAITNAKAANMVADTLKGRATASTGDPEDLALASLTAATPASGDFAVGYTSAGLLRIFDFDTLIGGGGGSFDETTTWACPIGGSGTGIVPANLQSRFKHFANAETDFGVSLYEIDGVTVKDNQAAIQDAIDKIQPYGGALYFPMWEEGARIVATGPLVIRDTGALAGAPMALIGMGSGERTYGQNGRFDLGNGLKLIDGSNADFIVSEAEAGYLVIENMILDCNYSGQSGSYRGLVFENKASTYGFGATLENVAIQSAGKAGLYIGTNRARSIARNLWVQYCQGASGEASVFCNTFDWIFENPAIGPNEGHGMWFATGAQLQIINGAIFLNKGVGMVVADTVRDIVVTGLAFDSNTQHGFQSIGYSGSTPGSRRLIGCNWRNQSYGVNNTYSDIMWTGQDLVVIAPHFEGDPAAVSKKPQYCMRSSDASAKATVIGPMFTSASYATAFASAPGQLTLGGPISPPENRPVVTGSRGSNAALTSLLTALANAGIITNSSS